MHARFCNGCVLLRLVYDASKSVTPSPHFRRVCLTATTQPKYIPKSQKSIRCSRFNTSTCHFQRHCHSAAPLQVDRLVNGTCARTKRRGSGISSPKLSGSHRPRSSLRLSISQASRIRLSDNSLSGLVVASCLRLSRSGEGQDAMRGCAASLAYLLLAQGRCDDS
jgi:hypothetical protein